MRDQSTFQNARCTDGTRTMRKLDCDTNPIFEEKIENTFVLKDDVHYGHSLME